MKNLVFFASVTLLIISCSKSDNDNSGGQTKFGAVDLGLSVKWANANIGATTPEGYGDYYAWGETATKNTYYLSDYKWLNSANIASGYTKYNASDNRTVLTSSDDAAHIKLGGNWRIPTIEEWNELITKCTWMLTMQNGVIGRLVTGKNGKTIFLPAAGNRVSAKLSNVGDSGYYWSSSLTSGNSSNAEAVNFSSGSPTILSRSRFQGFPIRAVKE